MGPGFLKIEKIDVTLYFVVVMVHGHLLVE